MLQRTPSGSISDGVLSSGLDFGRMRVLDVCAGSGASAIPAAEAVGPTGQVMAVDIAGELLARRRAKADARGLRQLDVRVGDLLDPDESNSTFDAVVCVFGIFFMADIVGAIRHLWSRVAPGGQLAITTWGPSLFEPANTRFWDAVRRERPDLYKQFKSLGLHYGTQGTSQFDNVSWRARPTARGRACYSFALLTTGLVDACPGLGIPRNRRATDAGRTRTSQGRQSELSCGRTHFGGRNKCPVCDCIEKSGCQPWTADYSRRLALRSRWRR
jgi:SAM-dependent methyltransferase